jgi:antitoxin FitA
MVGPVPDLPPKLRYSSAMATIQVRDVPDDVAEIYRRRATASGKSLQSYMREQLIALARRRDKAEAMAAVERALAGDPGPGLSADTIRSGLQELRGE